MLLKDSPLLQGTSFSIVIKRIRPPMVRLTHTQNPECLVDLDIIVAVLTGREKF